MSERLTVIIDGEEWVVFNRVNVIQPKVIRGHNPTVETFSADLGAGDSSATPEAVTKWVAKELSNELSIDLSNHNDITVVDIESDNVQVI